MPASSYQPVQRPAGPKGRGVPRLVAVLALTQTVGYGVLSYAFAVLLPPMAADLRVSPAVVAGAYTTSVVTAAAAAVPVGRWLDRHGGRALMTGGSALGVAAVVAWSQVRTAWQLYAVFAVIGVAMAASLYEAAFPVLIAAAGPAGRDRALVAVTIVAGFSSSVFFPLTGRLLEHLTWRATLLVLAALLAATAVPAHLWAVPGRRAHVAAAHGHAGPPPGEALRDARFWLLAAAFVAQGAATSAVGVLLVAYLRHAGQPATTAATLSGLLGILSVTGRVATAGAARRHGMTAVTAVVFAIQALGAALLPFAAGSVGWAALCVTGFGLGFGVATIARPAVLADRYGAHGYATIAAAMSVPVTLAKAGAPLAGAAIGIGGFLPWVAGACLVAAVLLGAVPGRRGNGPARR
ncbi:MFS transporter [Dactylosporangium sp. CA-092794]|uniref:MFS transporter n=1 Tax=Dactylosporangium sp. CA-092794 TaxID=3239929 RepID=UPI003D938461